MHNEASHLFIISSLHFLELVKKKEKYSFQLVNYYVTDTEKSKKGQNFF